jgi:hypothetical protein
MLLKLTEDSYWDSISKWVCSPTQAAAEFLAHSTESFDLFLCPPSRLAREPNNVLQYYLLRSESWTYF